MLEEIQLQQVLPQEIEKRSFEIITEELGNVELDPLQAPIIKRAIHTSADFAQVKYDGQITLEIARDALNHLEVDTIGLDQTDRNLLKTMMETFEGRPVGLDTLAAAIGEDSGTIEDVYEPYLIQNGLIQRTPRGRVVTRSAYEHFHLPIPEDR